MNHNSRSESYAAAGVDITAGYRAVELMKSHIARTMTAGVCSDIGGFGGLFELDMTGIEQPVLVSGTDGVGTKLKLAFLHGQARHRRHRLRGHVRQRHHLLRREAPALSGLHRLRQERAGAHRRDRLRRGRGLRAVRLRRSSAARRRRCRASTRADEYDLAGFAVGVVDKAKILDNTTMRPGDVVIALPSSGVHSNGFSLVRKVFDVEHADLRSPRAELGGRSLGEALLAPTKIYVKPMLALFDAGAREGCVPHHGRRLL